MKLLSKMTPAERQARISQLTASKNTAAIPTKYLPASLRGKRELNQRLDSPVVDGSSMTQRQLAKSRESAVTLKYGDVERQGQQAVGASQQNERDSAAWYDDYIKKLTEHQGNISTYGQNAVNAVNALGNAAPASQVDTANLSAENKTQGDNAAAVRKALVASVGAQLTSQGANANTYADTLSNVVAPGQKLSAQAQARGNTNKARENLLGLAKEKGAYRDQFTSQTVADETKNVLSQQALTGKTAAQIAAEANKAAALKETARHNKASETNAANDPSKKKTQAELDFFQKHGYWPPTGPPKPAKGTGKGGKGPTWVTPGQQSAFQTQVDNARSYAAELFKQKGATRKAVTDALMTTSEQQTVYDTKTGKRKLNPDGTPVTTAAWKAVSSAVASAAADMAKDNHLSAYTVRKLIAAGIKPGQLGYPTAGSLKKTTAKARNSPSERAPGGT